ncbi:acyl-CoA dehydrogenase family protein [Pseudonocardia kongjuensis]|uniref:Acyl-CoA dehydrogenase family protein n=1 Tax=Pseudonocardia kongjuensis TaxID=102227 RepID=A0ABN1XI03_9PSEU
MTVDSRERPVDDGIGPAGAVERARALYDLLDGEAAESEELGRLTAVADDALHAANLYGMWVPRSLGGLELDPLTSLTVIEETSRAHASAGWVLMAASLSTGTTAGYLGDEAIDELFTPGARTPILAGQGTRPGQATPVPGGFSVSGDWSFASGVRHAQYIYSAAVVAGTGEFRVTVAPIDRAELDQDSWDVLGLRATGSLDYRLRDVEVPEPFTHSALLQESPRGGALYRVGLVQTALIGHTGWALGVGRRVLDELAATARAKAGRAGQIAESDAFHTAFAEAEAKLRAARALAFESWADAWETLCAGDRLSRRQETLVRLSVSHATWTAEEIASFAYRSAGTSALRAGTMQRLYRDVHAGTQHITSGPAVVRASGRELAGLTSDNWFMLDIPGAAGGGGH